jgi:N-acetylmuramoyl-L-alanine amidase
MRLLYSGRGTTREETMRTLKLGDRGKEVADVQTRLRGLGYELGSEGVDGFFGPKTVAALKAFQQQRLLLVDGVLGANTWRELVEAGYTLGERLLYLRVPNFRGDDVLALQVKLNLLGFNAGPERGIFDEEVEHAVIEFQRNAGLPADGIVGENTLRTLDVLRNAERGREGKKIPDRDEGFVPRGTLAGKVVVLDPGHGGRDDGVVSPTGLREKDLTLALALRLAQLLRAEGCRVVLTRSGDDWVPLYDRPEKADTVGAEYFISLHANASDEAAATGATCYFFQRDHYYSEKGQRLAEYLGERLAAADFPFLGTFGRNYALLREPQAIAVVVEPLFLTNPAEARAMDRPGAIERLAVALLCGLEDYLSRA